MVEKQKTSKGSLFGGSVCPLGRSGDNKNTPKGGFLVAPTGLEPVTQGSSGLCSTN